MKPQIRTNRGFVGNEVFIRLQDITNYPRTILTADSAAGATTLAGLDVSFFNQYDYFMVGLVSVPETEIQQFNSATSSKTINLVGSTSFPHEQSSEVRFLPYNQVRIESSTDGVTYSTLVTQNLKVNMPEQYYNHTTGTATTYYRVRFYNSQTGLTTDPSDAVIATGYADNTVFAIKQRAVEASGLSMSDIYTPGSIINDTFLNSALFEGRRIVHNKRRRWNFRQSYNYIVGQVVGGTQSVALPTDMEDTLSAKNLYGVRIGGARQPLTQITKEKWNEWQYGRRHTTLPQALTAGATTINLTNSGDFDLSGGVSIVESGVLDSPSYTTNTRASNALTGVTSLTYNHTSGIDVWQNPGFGLPTRYTVWGGRIYFDIPIDLIYHGESILIDYYKTVPAVTSDAGVLDEPNYDMYVPFLKWRIRQARNQGTMATPPEQDPDYIEFITRVASLAENDQLDREVSFVPDIPNMSDEYLI